MENRKRKFNPGDIVSIKGYQENFIVDEWFREQSESLSEGFFENSWYKMKSFETLKYLVLIFEFSKEITLIQGVNGDIPPLSDNEVNILLDKYNQYLEIHRFLVSNGAMDDEYKGKADEIMSYLNK